MKTEPLFGLAALILPASFGAASDSAKALYDQIHEIKHNTSLLHDTKAPGWVSAPTMRGTTSILWSCLLTLFACVYTALHLNIPERGITNVQLVAKRIEWMFITLLFPELVLFYASAQWWKAKKLAAALSLEEKQQLQISGPPQLGTFRKVVNKMLKQNVTRSTGDIEKIGSHESSSSSTINDSCIFDLKYGFYVLMGGLEAELDGKTVILSHHGALLLAQKDIKPFRIPRSTHLGPNKSRRAAKAVGYCTGQLDGY
ncbi:hypothetical protein QC762_302811 [Podospora pseudocomata]|uniref:Uncharacterized protein n=1 Tax=Podospora pseudocomata TaxID=2093779 RepID=A0ABR0GI97_9PEZI|nr:hypothetical protein QC762_302811 [Podospora pseudocomata]